MTNNCRSEFPPLPQRVLTERLVIRPSMRDDAPYLQKWWNDPAVTEPGGPTDGMHYDDGDMEDWFRRYVDGRDCSTHFMICLRDLDTPIGEFYIAWDDRPGCVGFALAIGETDSWGNGYASEALEAYADAVFESGLCEALRMDTRLDNERAIRMCEQVGFQVEHVWANGLFQTMILTRAAFEYKQYKAGAE
jgi:RimJ/RimL family protein N-acetyltransferase